MYIRISHYVLSLLLPTGFQSQLAAQDTAEEEEEFRNSVELFLGAVTETDESATGPGIGIEYKRPSFGPVELGDRGPNFRPTM